jgi:hypothetical protein
MNDDILTMPVDELKKRVDQVLALLAQIDGLLPGLVELTEEARDHAHRFRNREAEASVGLLDVADKKPGLFDVLADKDNGADPKVFETALLRDRLQRLLILAPAVLAAKDLAGPLTDTRLHLTNLVKPVLSSMYAIAKPQADRDVTIASMIKDLIDLYAAIGRASAATRKAKKAGK